jgi:Ca-activated chloride channel homolog
VVRLPIVLATTCSLAVSLAAQTFRTETTLVPLPVLVTTRANEPVEGLQSADFAVFDNGDPTPIVTFSAGSSEQVPLHLGLMLDRSLSMQADFSSATAAAIKFVGAMDTAVDTTLVEFDTGVRVGRYAPSEYVRLFNRIRDTRLGPHTVFYEAITRFLERIHGQPGEHILVAYTDGGDDSSRMTALETRDLLRGGNAILYAIGYLENQAQADRLKQLPLLTMLARETGGEAFFPTSPRDVTQVYERIRREIQGRYTLGIVPSAASRPGQFRRIEVRLTDPARRALRLRTRSGYLTPPP